MKLKFGYLLRRVLWRVGLVIRRLDPRTTAMIGVTYFCQCHCSHCSMAKYPKNKKEELSKEELIEMIKRFPRNKIAMIYFFWRRALTAR